MIESLLILILLITFFASNLDLTFNICIKKSVFSIKIKLYLITLLKEELQIKEGVLTCLGTFTNTAELTTDDFGFNVNIFDFFKFQSAKITLATNPTTFNLFDGFLTILLQTLSFALQTLHFKRVIDEQSNIQIELKTQTSLIKIAKLLFSQGVKNG